MKRSMFSVGVFALLAAVSFSAHAQLGGIGRPGPLPAPTVVRPVGLAQPAQAYTTITTLAGVPGRAGNLDNRPTWSTFNSPTLVTVDQARGAVYVVDVMNESVRVIVGGRVETFASRISAMVDATGVALDPTTETLIFTLRSNNQLFALTRKAQWLTPVNAVEGQMKGGPARFSSPSGIIRDEQGSFYIGDQGSRSIRKMSRGVVTTFAQGGNDFLPRALARDPRDGTIYALAGSGVYRASPNGAVTPYAATASGRGLRDGYASTAQLNDPRGIAVDNVGRVFVSDAQVQPDGTTRGFIRQIAFMPQVARPASVGVTQESLYVSTLWFQGSGATAAIPVALARPNGLAMWNNSVVLADTNLNTVDILN